MFPSRMGQQGLVLFFLFTIACVQESTGKICTFDIECNQNQSCYNNECKCQMGFNGIPDGTDFKCNQIECQDDYDCANFPKSECKKQLFANRGICQCKDDYRLDAKKLVCELGKSLPSKFCSFDKECLGFFEECKDGMCTCQPGFVLDSATKECVTRNVTTPRNSTNELDAYFCSMSSQCGDNSYCDSRSGKCQCKFGFEASTNRRDCYLKSCYSSDDCLPMFKYSTCEDNRCNCASHYQLDTTSQQCQPKPETTQCKYDSDCGIFSVCVNNVCKCELGFSSPWVEGWNGCERVKCSSSQECNDLFPGTRCDYGQEKCVCDIGFQFNPANQSCYEPYATTTESTYRSTTPRTSCSMDRDCPNNLICSMYNQCICPNGKYLDPIENLCIYRDRHEPIYTHTSSSNTGMIVGISLGSVVVIVLTGVVIWRCCRKRVVLDQQRQEVKIHVGKEQGKRSTAQTQPSAPSASPQLPPRSTMPQPPPPTAPFHQYQMPTQPSFNPAYVASAEAANAQPNYHLNPNIGIRVYPTLPGQ